jgi:hypothetical protein
MGTRSITVIRRQWGDSKLEPIATIYRHWDGYPSVHGAWLADFLSDITLVNGISADTPKRYANGSGHLAAILISDLQIAGHDPKLESYGASCGQEYTYIIDINNGLLKITVTVLSGPMTAFGAGGDECTNEIFSGSVEEFSEWIYQHES